MQAAEAPGVSVAAAPGAPGAEVVGAPGAEAEVAGGRRWRGLTVGIRLSRRCWRGWLRLSWWLRVGRLRLNAWRFGTWFASLWLLQSL